jgi:hypothetical protein
VEPFTITCTTCKSRLKVRSAAAIGQLVPCPKCGGMVMVKAPEPGPSPDTQNAATKPVEPQSPSLSPEHTQEFDDIELILAGSPRVPAATAVKDKPGTTQSAPLSAELPAAAAAPLARAATAEPSQTATKPVPPEGEAPALPDPNWAANRPARYGAWLAISILAGIALAVAVTVVSIRVLRGDRGSVATVEPLQLPPKTAATEPTAESPANSAPPARTFDPPSAETPEESKTPADAVPPDGSESPSEPKSAPPPASDPLELTSPAAPSAEPKPPPPADPFGKFADVLGEASDPLLPTAPSSVPASDAAAMPKGSDELPPERPAAPRPPPRRIDLAARLADPLPAIEADKVPLADFLRTMSDLSTIPITLAPDHLAYGRLTADSPVSVKLDDTTVGKALAEALRPLSLEVVAEEDQVVVRPAEYSGSGLANLTYPVEDLTGKDDAQVQTLSEWMTALCGSPEDWKEGQLTPGREVFQIEQRRSVHAQLFFLCEKLRVARGLSPKSKYDAALFRLESRTARARPALSKPITLNFGHGAALVAIVRRMEETAGVRILFDWRALSAEGWNPDGEATLVAEAQPLGEALTALLSPLSLAWRVVDDRTLQITSVEALAATRELEFYPVSELAADAEAGDALLARLRTTLEAGMPAEPPLALVFDPASRCILASLPQPLHRETERLLSQWKAEAAAAAK